MKTLEEMDNAKCRECGTRNKNHYLYKMDHRFKWPKDWSNK
jgi:hypothetical protein